MKATAMPRGHASGRGRRRWLARALALGALPWVAASQGARTALHPRSAAAMREAQEAEMGVYWRYSEFGRLAQQEGYRGVAYLFAAFSSAELIHANNFGRVLSRLGVEVAPIAKPPFNVGSTRDNLVTAAEVEVHSVDVYYPQLLERIESEGHRDAMEAARWAWDTEKQHRDDIEKIRRWAPTLFEEVARRIDEKSDRYYVCQICGNTVHEVPAPVCQICRSASSHFRLIDPPA